MRSTFGRWQSIDATSALLARLAEAGQPRIHQLPVPQAREAFAALAELLPPGPDLHTVSEDTVVADDGYRIPVRVYSATETRAGPSHTSTVGDGYSGPPRNTTPPSGAGREHQLCGGVGGLPIGAGISVSDCRAGRVGCDELDAGELARPAADRRR